jgi:hypothetical protein
MLAFFDDFSLLTRNGIIREYSPDLSGRLSIHGFVLI